LDTIQMSAALSRLSTIVTSRYHALVMPLAYAVPFIAIGHDNRLRYIAHEMGFEQYFLPSEIPNLAGELIELHRRLVTDAADLRPRLAAAFADFQERDQENYRLLAEVVKH
jgi:polysaccharide pyruvyl transferase WcaK-like protein